MTTDFVASEAQLRERYDTPKDMILKLKLARLDEHARRFISLSPFLVLATRGDASPKGDAPGFVRVVDDATLLIPDRAGNNKLDTLRNILDDPAVGMIFLIPGFNETLRVNGRARVTMDPDPLAPLAVDGKAPKSGIVVDVEEVYLHCGKALLRARLWDPEARTDRAAMPTMGRMVADQIAGLDADEIETGYQEALKTSLY
ncbi:MAG: pyridoxamine 5'-phosphate oxidase family protein [Alphaproteobacteria bacterium]|nr:pyridoxamine 5'-phosphate oxidase family protein [Alphaproteobacteria bacterium]